MNRFLVSRLDRLSPSGVLILSLALILIFRASTLEYPSLIDPTESRYADISETMVSSGGWLTPHVWLNGKDVPYLGKPPLHFWLTSIVYTFGGLDEWSARLVSFLSLLVICAALGVFAEYFFERETGLLAMVVCATSAGMFFLSGASLIDVTLTACVSSAITAFALGVAGPKSRGAILAGYAALALAMLTKGPVGVLFAAIVLVPWVVISRKRIEWKNLCSLSGVLLFFAIAAPWYILAEWKNPGFLKYFFVNENFLRFFVRDYGDRYGSGHRFPFGSAWWMAALSFLPWTPLVAAAVFRRRGEFIRWVCSSPALVLAALWALAPLCFLTVIRQLHIGYILPALPGLSLLTACVVSDVQRLATGGCILSFERYLRRVATLILFVALPILTIRIGGADLWPAVFVPIVLGIAILSWKRFPNETLGSALGVLGLIVAVIFSATVLATDAFISREKSTSRILWEISGRNPGTRPRVTFINEKTFSSRFYAAAWEEELQAPVIADYLAVDEVDDKLPENLVVESKAVSRLPEVIRAHYREVFSEGKWSWLKLKV